MYWSGGYVEWVNGNTAFLSVVFSWMIDRAIERARYYRFLGYRVVAGGPAVTLNPGCFGGFAEENPPDIILSDVVARHNPMATFTTRGCVNRCPFCAVPKIEGELVELSEWPLRPVICDNNLLAASIDHFDSVIDRLIENKTAGVDFNQGLDARLLNEYHARRIAELHKDGLLKCVRLAWDDSRLEKQFRRAWNLLHDAGVPKRSIRIYVLFGFSDTPEDAEYRLQTVRQMGSLPNPMRYQALDSRRRNEYVRYPWTHDVLVRFMRYWANARVWGVPFNEFVG